LQNILENYGKVTTRNIAKNLDLSERRVKQLIKEIFSVGSALSAINPNLRNMHTCLLIYGFIALIISFYFDNHKIIFTIIDISLACGFVVSVIDGIQNMRNGVDPDVLKAKRQREKKFKRLFTLSRLLIRFWRW